MSNRALNRKLSDAQLKELKARLWAGFPSARIAEFFNVSAAHVSRVLHGHAAYSTPWPNGSTGPMPAFRIAQIRDLRHTGGYQNKALHVLEEPPASPDPEAELPSREEPPTEAGFVQEKLISEQRARSLNDALTSIGERINQEMQDELRSSIKAPPEAPSEPTNKARFDPNKIPMRPWGEITKLASEKNLYVNLASEDAVLRTAIMIVYKQTEPEVWESTPTKALVKSTFEMLKRTEGVQDFISNFAAEETGE